MAHLVPEILEFVVGTTWRDVAQPSLAIAPGKAAVQRPAATRGGSAVRRKGRCRVGARNLPVRRFVDHVHASGPRRPQGL